MVVLAGLCTGVTSRAQVQFAELGKRHLPIERTAGTHAVFADLDGDRDPDLLLPVAGNGKRVEMRYCLNDGSGVFLPQAPRWLPALPAEGSVTVMRSFDADQDGDLDVVLAVWLDDRTELRLWLNAGNGRFAESPHSPLAAKPTRQLAIGDLDRDGDLDLVMGGSAGIDIALNQGAGRFTEASTWLPYRQDSVTALTLFDADGDGDLDLHSGHAGRPMFGIADRLWRNTGTGFADVTNGSLPMLRGETRAVHATDLDVDGAIDLIVVSTRGSYVYGNDGLGHFAASATLDLPQPDPFFSSHPVLASGDLDRDGDPDILFGMWSSRMLRNDGRMRFSPVAVPSAYASVRSLALADIEGDGDLDLLAVQPGTRSQLLANDGRGTFTDLTATPMPGTLGTRAAAAGDLDGDGDPDLVMATLEGPQILANDGRGWFTHRRSGWSPAAHDPHDVALADTDGDGDLDLIFACGRDDASQNAIFVSDAGTAFRPEPGVLPSEFARCACVAATDIDRDGDIDLVFGEDQGTAGLGRMRLLINDGTGKFADETAMRLPMVWGNCADVLWVDVDADGDPDLVAAMVGSQNRLWHNDGSGHFVDATDQLPADAATSRAVAAGDVDGDGDVDLVFANGENHAEQSTLYHNDGRGKFDDVTPLALPARLRRSGSVVLTDVDEDGDADLVFGNGRPGKPDGDELWRNDGAGNFVPTAAWPALPSYTSALLAFDADGDADMDLLLGEFQVPAQDRLLFNLTRQLDTPLALRAGRPFVLELHSPLTPPGVVDVALPAVSLAPGRLALPIGMLGLDPAQAVALPPVMLPGSRGRGMLVLAIPANPALVGMNLFAQALFAQQGRADRLGNVTADVLIR